MGRGVKLYMNFIETAFIPPFWPTVVSWFEGTFTEQERLTWAVFDHHWYSAWKKDGCKGVTTGVGGFSCDAGLDAIRKKLRYCIQDTVFGTKAFVHHYPVGLKAITEFSVATDEYAPQACTSANVTALFLEEQVHAFQESGIENLFWTWRMPWGTNFESGWSLKYLAGREHLVTAGADSTCHAA